MSMYEPYYNQRLSISQNENRNSVMHGHGMVIVQLFDRRHETSYYYINLAVRPCFQVHLTVTAAWSRNEYDQALSTHWTEDEVLIKHNVINEHVSCW